MKLNLGCDVLEGWLNTRAAGRVGGHALKLNLGCGRNVLEGWLNTDLVAVPGKVIGNDLERPPLCGPWAGNLTPSPFSDDVCDEFRASHVLEHVRNVLPLMQECWRIAKPGALFTARVPYGSSDDADEDPTHVRRFFLGSWNYFGQPNYERADYGYRGDWHCRRIVLHVERERIEDLQLQTLVQIVSAATLYRNVVKEMVAELEAVKPARRQLQSETRSTKLDVQLVG